VCWVKCHLGLDVHTCFRHRRPESSLSKRLKGRFALPCVHVVAVVSFPPRHVRKTSGRVIREPTACGADFVVLLLTNAWKNHVSDNSHDNHPRLFAESKSTLQPHLHEPVLTARPGWQPWRRRLA
jgi:hypothetical protein